jgi:microcystin-dependent protein
VSEPFLGEIVMFGGNFAPRGWAFCNGQLLSISQNTALFSILGTTYGGNGTTTFALPDLRGRAPMHQGQGPGLSPRQLGEQTGTESVQLLTSEMPAHNHPALGSTGAVNTTRPTNAIPAKGGSYTTAGPDTTMNAQAIGVAGNNLPHENMPPQLAVSFIIATEGIFPSRN